MALSGRERAQIQLDYKRLHSAADSRVPQLKRIIANALNAAYNSVTDLEAADAYSHSPESFRRAIDWRAVGTILGASKSDYTVYKATTAADVFGEVFIDGGKTASAGLSGSLTMTEPFAIAYGEQRAGTLIQGIQTQQLNTVRSAIGAGLAEGIPPQRTGRLLRVTTGLSERQGASLVNYERGLTQKMLTGSTSTVLRGAGRPLADQRYSLANLNQQKVDNLVERYRERLVNYRAEMIARTETIRAANMGAFAEQRAQASAGLFDAKTATRVWQTTPDDRACDECSDLDGQTVGFEQSFVLSADADSNTTGENMSGEVPPLHPMCRCTFYLDVSLESLTNAFRDGNFDFGAETRTLDDLLGPRWQEGFRPGSQMPLPSLPQLNYLPPSVPSARGGAAAEEVVTAPRARRARTVKPKPAPPIIDEAAIAAEALAAETAAAEALAAEVLAAETAAAEAAAARGAEAAARAASAAETAAAETEAAAQATRSGIQTNGKTYVRGQSRDTYETFDFLTESKPLETARPDVLRWERMKEAERVAYDIAERQGFANLPEVGNAARLAEEIQAGGTELFSGQRTSELVEEFKTGQFRFFDNANNRTNTFSPNFTAAQDAAQQGTVGAETRIVNAVLRADAKTITLEDAWAAFGEVERGGDLLVLADDFEMLESYLRSVRMEEWISAQGYDAIYTKGLGVYDESYTILNRTSVVVRDSASIDGSALKAIGEVPVITEAGKAWELTELVEFVDSASEQTYGKLLEEMSKIHNFGTEVPRSFSSGIAQQTTVQSVEELLSGLGGQAGGNFTPGLGRGAAPSINMNSTYVYRQNTFMHEMGHRVDAVYVDGNFTSFFTEGGSPEAIDFLRAATKESGSYLNNLNYLQQTQSQGYVAYFEEGVEVWARAYEQFMAYELEAVMPELAQSIRTGNAALTRIQWDEAEFRKYIGPKVREVLRSRGLLASVEDAVLAEAAAVSEATATATATAVETESLLGAARTVRTTELQSLQPIEPPPIPARTQAQVDEVNRLMQEHKAFKEELRLFHYHEKMASDGKDVPIRYEEYLRLKAVKEQEQILVKQIFAARNTGDASIDTVENAARWARASSKQAEVTRPTTINAERWARAREAYVGQDAKTLQMNAAMRAEEVTPALKRRINDALHMTQGVLKEDAVLSRSIALSPARANALRVGETIETLGFQSTEANASGLASQYNRTNAYWNTINVVTEMRIPAGVHAADVGYSEIVLRPGNVRIISRHWDGNTLRLVTEWIS